MAPPKQVPQDKEDISQLRKPIILHGKPVEQILNSIHYGSPELQSLLLDECDMIFECKVCRALFRDLPNFIAHKRRYCSQSACDKNYLSIADLPDERLIVVHPEPVDSSETTRNSSKAAKSSRSSLEDSLQRIRSGETGNSHAFRVYSNAADKLQHQRDHTKITSLRTRSIPTNSNAVFVDVSTTSVNIHDRPSSSTHCENVNKSNATKVVEKRKANLRSTNKSNDDPEDLSVVLLRELKCIQTTKSKQPTQKAAKVNKTQNAGGVKPTAKDHGIKSKPKVDDVCIETVQSAVRNESSKSKSDNDGKPLEAKSKTKHNSCKGKLQVDAEKPEDKKSFARNESLKTNLSPGNEKFENTGLLLRIDRSKPKSRIDTSKAKLKFDEGTELQVGNNNCKSEGGIDDEPEGKSQTKNSLSRARDYDEAGLIEVKRRNLKAAVLKCKKTEEQCDESPSSKSSSNNEVLISKEDLNRSKSSLVCANCGVIFSSRKSLLFHINVHHAVKRTFYPCLYCANLYYYIAAVQRHIRINHKKSKSETAQMWYDIKKNSISKVVPSNEPLVKVKRNLSGIRRSARYSATCMNKKSNSNPYIYSSLTGGRRKELLVKKHLALKESSEADVKTTIAKLNSSGEGKDKKEQETICNSLPVDPCLQDNFDGQKDLKNEQDVLNDANGIPSTTKPSTSYKIDTEMTSCKTCSRLFGRKTTLEKHTKTCEGRLPATSSNSISEGDSSAVPKGSDIENKETVNIDSPETSAISDVTLNRRLRRTSDSSTRDEVDSSDLFKVSTTGVRRKTRQGNDQVHRPLVSPDTKMSVCDKSSIKVKAEQIEQSGNSEKQSAASTSNTKQSPTSLDNKEGKPHVEMFASVSKASVFVSLTKLKSKGGLSTQGMESFEVDSHAQLCQPGQDPESNVFVTSNSGSLLETGDSREKTAHINLEEKESRDSDWDSEVDEKPEDLKISNVMERPRRKRKIPSRNIGALEFFKKIHRLDLDRAEPLGKKLKRSLTNMSPLNNQQSNRGKSDQKEMVNGKANEIVNDVSRKRRNASRVFVLNSNNAGVKGKSKLRCYNHNKVENYMDCKKRCCLKCGSTFTNLNNLKRHIVRLHLKWSRFKCKLCSFSCFDKSECNTHIVRCHRGEATPVRNCFNSLIDDLTEKGSRAMSLKKSETLKAKNRRKTSDENIYKNQNAQKNPRLPERKPETSTTLTPPKDSSDRGIEGNDSLQTTSSSVDTGVVTLEVPNYKHGQKVSRMAEKTQGGDMQQAVSSDISLSSDMLGPFENPGQPQLINELITTSKVSHSSSSGDNSNMPSVKKPSLPFNISTRNSPRVFDTTPYNRTESETVTVRAPEKISQQVQTLPANK